uniref:Uncharacterized protein n=1 Tax=Aegilops tauschii subsp. strangulata TaxID=200361 RepID=A0A453FJ18_AEGTS
APPSPAPSTTHTIIYPSQRQPPVPTSLHHHPRHPPPTPSSIHHSASHQCPPRATSPSSRRARPDTPPLLLLPFFPASLNPCLLLLLPRAPAAARLQLSPLLSFSKLASSLNPYCCCSSTFPYLAVVLLLLQAPTLEIFLQAPLFQSIYNWSWQVRPSDRPRTYPDASVHSNQSPFKCPLS